MVLAVSFGRGEQRQGMLLGALQLHRIDRLAEGGLVVALDEAIVKMRDVPVPVFMRLSGLPEMLFAVIWLFEVFR